MDKNMEHTLERTAAVIRRDIIDEVHAAKSGHPGGSLSIADNMTYLYFYKMKVDPSNPQMEDRDRFVLSKGHAAPALYAALAERGFFPKELLITLRHPGSILQGHPTQGLTPGVDMTTGSLGQGISAAVGMALGARLNGETYRVYAALGDGELQEGEVWEAAMFASAKKLDNLVAFIDNNNLQIDGTIDEVNSPYPIDEKFRAFGWNVLVIDGHDFSQLDEAYTAAEQCKGRPTAIVARTVKGKGVSYMENQVGWHGKAPNDEQYEEAVKELDAALAKLDEKGVNYGRND